MMDTSRIETRLGRTIRTLLEVRQETKAHFLVGRVILGFLSIFKKSQASSPLESLNSVCLSRYQSYVIPPIQMRRRTMAFSRVSTGDSDIPSSCEMKHEPELKHCWEIWPSLSQDLSRSITLETGKTGSLSHTYCLGKIPLEVLVESWLKSSKTGNQLSSWDDMGCLELSSSCCTDINIHIDLGRFLRESLSVRQGKQATCTVCCGTRDRYGGNEGEMGFILC